LGSAAGPAAKIRENGFKNSTRTTSGRRRFFHRTCPEKEIVLLRQGNIPGLGLALPAANPYIK
jgi:hypothetical protein